MSDFKVNDVVKISIPTLQSWHRSNVYLRDDTLSVARNSIYEFLRDKFFIVTEVYYTENGKYLISIKELDGDPILNNRFNPNWFELQVDKTRDYKLNQILNENL